MLGNVIADQLTKSRNWPLASAISMVLTLVTTVGVISMLVLQKRDEHRLGKLKAPRGGGTRGGGTKGSDAKGSDAKAGGAKQGVR
jgi:hypothetical protein